MSVPTVARKAALFMALTPITWAAPDLTDPGQDFSGYMEDLEEQKREAEHMAAMFAEHEEWRQNTWGGWLVRQLQALGHHFYPFFEQIGQLMQEINLSTSSPSSANALLLVTGLRALTIAGYILAAYAVARVLNYAVFGRTIVIEEEIIVEHDEDDTDEGKEKGDNGSTIRRRRRGAKDRNDR